MVFLTSSNAVLKQYTQKKVANKLAQTLHTTKKMLASSKKVLNLSALLYTVALTLHIFGLKTPGNMTSWELFDILLEQVQIVSTPGSGFGPHGEGYLRLTAFGSRENTIRAVERIKTLQF